MYEIKNECFLGYVPKIMITEKMCKIAIKCNKHSLNYVPESIRNKILIAYYFEIIFLYFFNCLSVISINFFLFFLTCLIKFFFTFWKVKTTSVFGISI